MKPCFMSRLQLTSTTIFKLKDILPTNRPLSIATVTRGLPLNFLTRDTLSASIPSCEGLVRGYDFVVGGHVYKLEADLNSNLSSVDKYSTHKQQSDFLRKA